LLVGEKEEGGGYEAGWSGPNHWVEVEIGLIGTRDRMMAFTPAVVAHTPPTTTVITEMVDEEEEEDEEEEAEPYYQASNDEQEAGEGIVMQLYTIK
jgi:hypothetical protein